MRYVSKGEREHQRKLERERAERQRWITLAEAVKYIQDRGGLSEGQALKDIISAINRWNDRGGDVRTAAQ